MKLQESSRTCCTTNPLPPVLREGLHTIAAGVAQRLDDSARRIERGQAGDARLDSGATDAEAILHLDATGRLARSAGDRVDDKLHCLAANQADDLGTVPSGAGRCRPPALANARD